MAKYDYKLRDFEPGDIVWVDTPWLCCDFGCTQSIIEIVEFKYDKCKYFFKKLDHFAYYYKGNEGDVYEMPVNTGCSPLATKSGKENEYWHEDYDKSQCVYGPESTMPCMVCSATCPARHKDLIEKGVKVTSIDELVKQEIEGPLNWTDEQHAAYQCAYDLSNDWLKEDPDWDDVQEAFLMGVKYGKENKWISVKDSLPPKFTCDGKEYNESITVAVKISESNNWHMATYYYDTKEWICEENNTYVIRDGYGEVTHWMKIEM